MSDYSGGNFAEVNNGDKSTTIIDGTSSANVRTYMNCGAGGGLPSGAVMAFNLAACPSGWSELVAARGRYIVGLPNGGTLAGTTGTELSNNENRAVGQHTHNMWFAAGGSGPRRVNTAENNAGGPITTEVAGSVVGTNAPYIQLLVCQKD